MLSCNSRSINKRLTYDFLTEPNYPWTMTKHHFGSNAKSGGGVVKPCRFGKVWMAQEGVDL